MNDSVLRRATMMSTVIRKRRIAQLVAALTESMATAIEQAQTQTETHDRV